MYSLYIRTIVRLFLSRVMPPIATGPGAEA